MSEDIKMEHEIYIYIAIMSVITLAIRILPLTLIRHEIKDQQLRSFLYYVPYTTLAVMTFPSIIDATQSPFSGVLALISGIISAWFGASLFQVAIICCIIVFTSELFIL